MPNPNPSPLPHPHPHPHPHPNQVNKHADDYSCLRLKESQAQAAMQAWHCARPTSSESAWCKRDQLLKKLRVLSLVCAHAAPTPGGLGGAHTTQACCSHACALRRTDCLRRGQRQGAAALARAHCAARAAARHLSLISPLGRRHRLLVHLQGAPR